MKFDDVLHEIGDFGPYQKRMFAIIIIPSMLIAQYNLAIVFTLNDHDHICATDEEHYNATWTNVTYSKMVSSKCTVDTIRVYNQTFNTTTRTACTSWVFSKDDWTRSLVSDFDLVCDRTILRSHAAMSYYAGMIFGAFLSGFLGDMYVTEYINLNQIVNNRSQTAKDCPSVVGQMIALGETKNKYGHNLTKNISFREVHIPRYSIVLKLIRLIGVTVANQIDRWGGAYCVWSLEIWYYTKRNEIRRTQDCFNVASVDKILGYGCHGKGGNQHWIYTENNTLKNIEHNKCLAIGSETALVMEECTGSEEQQWTWTRGKPPGPVPNRQMPSHEF